jgi:hypothetical protein
MARSERQKQKANQRKQARRKDKQDVRRSRNATLSKVRRAGLSQVMEWPFGDAYIGEAWHERGARFPVFVTRRHPSGEMAAVFFELDLGVQGVTHAKLESHVHPGVFQKTLAEVSEQDQALMIVSPAHALACVEAAWELSEAGGHELPRGFASARAFFGELQASDDVELLTGQEEQPGKKTGGFWSSLKERLG